MWMREARHLLCGNKRQYLCCGHKHFFWIHFISGGQIITDPDHAWTFFGPLGKTYCQMGTVPSKSFITLKYWTFLKFLWIFEKSKGPSFRRPINYGQRILTHTTSSDINIALNLPFTRLSCAGEKDEAGVCQVAGLWADPRYGGAAEWGAPHRPRLPPHQDRGAGGRRGTNQRGLILFFKTVIFRFFIQLKI